VSAEQSSLLPADPAGLRFFRRSDSHAESACGRYLIQWADNAHGRWYNAWHTPPSPGKRKHLYAGDSDDDAKAHCRSHSAFNQPTDNTKG